MTFKTNTLIGLISLSTLAFTTGCQDSTEPPPPVKPAVQYLAADYTKVTPTVEFVGRTVAHDTVIIKAKVRGTLIERAFKEGADVARGDLLYKIDPSEYQTLYDQAKAKVAQAKAEATTTYNNWKRGTELVDDNFISKSDMDRLEGSKLSSEAALENAQAALADAKLNLDDTSIHSPIAGRISRSKVSVGDLIQADQTELATLNKLHPIYVIFQVPERVMYASREKNYSRDDYVIRIRFPNGSFYDQPGQLDYIANQVDPTMGTLEIRAIFDNVEQKILPGQFVSISVEAPETRSALMIPQRAVQEDQQGRYALIVGEDNKISRRNIVLGQREGVNWTVVSGLEQGDKVITQGLQRIRTGIEVDATADTNALFTPNPSEENTNENADKKANANQPNNQSDKSAPAQTTPPKASQPTQSNAQ